jgi:hypothetical protein
MSNPDNGSATSSEFMAETAAIEAAITEAVREAVLRHKRLGNPIAVWKDGKVVIVPPEEIEVDETPPTGNDDPGSPH